jgi:hypothetical protein
MRTYCLQGAIGWLVAGAFISWLISTTEGPGAWWIMLVVSPYVIAYGIGVGVYWRDDF